MGKAERRADQAMGKAERGEPIKPWAKLSGEPVKARAKRGTSQRTDLEGERQLVAARAEQQVEGQRRRRLHAVP